MRTYIASAVIGACCLLMANSDLANAQAMRTWVSGVGDDVNPCTRVSPCKTFAGAISKTAAFGEINCTDPGGFGAVTSSIATLRWGRSSPPARTASTSTAPMLS